MPWEYWDLKHNNGRETSKRGWDTVVRIDKEKMAIDTKCERVFCKGYGGKNVQNFRKTRKGIMKYFKKFQVKWGISKIIVF